MRLKLLLALCLAWAAIPATMTLAQAQAELPAPPGGDGDKIVAVVNGQVITQADVENRARLFAISAGQAVAPDTLTRLYPQITRQLIDDSLRMQEIQHRKIVVPDADVANAIADIEKRNGLQHGGLPLKLANQGVTLSTLISQIRTQLGWTRVLRQELSERGRISLNDIKEQQRVLKAEQGQPQYQLSEIFVAAEDPSRASEAQRFASTVIQQLRAGAPFGIVAAEFSQSQTALEGGDLGWMLGDQLDPAVAAVVSQMPIGAISNPIRVAGGYDVVTVSAKRQVGFDMATVLNLRQAFYPFTTALDPAAPTDQQKQQLAAGEALSKDATNCGAMEAANKAQGSKRPTDPGDVRLDRLSPQMQQLLGSLKPGQASHALVTPEGIMVVMVCKRETKNLAAMTDDDIGNQLLEERVELASRQLLQDLKRRALIDDRGLDE